MQNWTIVALGLPLLLATPAWSSEHSSDWGYEQDAKPIASMLPSSPPGVKAALSSETDRQHLAIQYWLELYQLASSDNELTEDQQKTIQQSLRAKIAAGQSNDVVGICEFWPAVKRLCELMPDEKENYKELMRSLLRVELRDTDTVRTTLNEAIRGEYDVILQVLGPVRIAVPGDPPLTEAAIKAYADMACFIFEQNHPGRTVDAEDNRTVFANVICEKFRQAPDNAARQAMLNFDLTWAKFKILWSKATSQQRQQLLDQWVSTSVKPDQAPQPAASNSAGKLILTKVTPVNDPVLGAVLNNGPWRKPLLSQLAKPPVH